MNIERQDSAQVIGHALGETTRVLREYFDHLNDNAQYFSITDIHISGVPEFSIEYKMGDPDVLHNVRFHWKVTCRVSAFDSKVQMDIACENNEYEFQGFEPNQTVDPYKVQDYNKNTMVYGFLATVIHNMAWTFDREIYTQVVPIGKGLSMSYMAVSELLRLSHIYIDSFDGWNLVSTYTLSRFQHTVQRLLGESLSCDFRGMYQTTKTLEILYAIKPLYTAKNTMYKRYFSNMEEDISKAIQKEFSRISVGKPIERSEYASQVLDVLADTFHKNIRIYKDLNGYGLELDHSKLTTTLYFHWKQEKLCRTNSNAKIAKRKELYQRLS